MTIHSEPHPLSGRTVRLSPTVPPAPNGQTMAGADFVVEDWWDRVSGSSWMDAIGNPAAMIYAIRSGVMMIPLDDEVVYGKVDGLGHLVHVSELIVDAEGARDVLVAIPAKDVQAILEHEEPDVGPWATVWRAVAEAVGAGA